MRITLLFAVRATNDVDVAICVNHFADFNNLTDSLKESSLFFPTQMIHRLSYQNKLPVDILPFGINDNYEEIRWPPKYDTQMSTLGFKETYSQSNVVVIQDKPIINLQVASYLGLVVLKFFAWNDRHLKSDKDATDLLILIQYYLHTDNVERLFDQFYAFVENTETQEEAGAKLLGLDIKKSYPDLVKPLVAILSDKSIDKMVLQMSRTNNDKYEAYLKLVTCLKEGMS